MGDILIIWPDVYNTSADGSFIYGRFMSSHDGCSWEERYTYLHGKPVRKSTKLYVNIPVPFIISIIY